MTASAKSYFRAINGQRVEPPSLPLDLHRQTAPYERQEGDFYPTAPLDAIHALLQRDGTAIQACDAVWEPACGRGDLVKPMRSLGLQVHASDLVDRGCPDSGVGDYFARTTSPCRAIITNPPYNLISARDGKGRWLRHTLDMPGWDYLALLLNWEWPAARANGFGEMLDARPFSYALLCRWKIDFTGGGSPPQRNAWFVWRKDWTGYPGFFFLDRPVSGAGDQIPML